jgi:thiaminase
MVFESDKIMFEIYKDTLYRNDYRVVYYTELNEHNKQTEINRAMAGEHYYDGFIKEYRKDEAKKIIAKIVEDLNKGVTIEPVKIREMLAEFIP